MNANQIETLLKSIDRIKTDSNVKVPVAIQNQALIVKLVLQQKIRLEHVELEMRVNQLRNFQQIVLNTRNLVL